MKLSDDVIGHIAQLLQMAILTGTDIIDNMRMVELEFDKETNKLYLTKSYQERHSDNIGRLVEEGQPQEETVDLEG